MMTVNIPYYKQLKIFQRGHLEVSKALLDHGANVNAETKDGWTPLHYAAGVRTIY